MGLVGIVVSLFKCTERRKHSKDEIVSNTKTGKKNGWVLVIRALKDIRKFKSVGKAGLPIGSPISM